MNVSFVLVQNDGSQREIALNKPRMVIGRDTGCQIRIPVSDVSRQHCEVVIDGDSVVLKDLGSSNGTFVNRRRVSQTELAAGDVVGVGPAVFAVRIDGTPAKFDSAAVLKQIAPAPGAPSSVAAAVAAPAAPTAGKARKGSILDDLDDAPGAAGNDDSSMADFDFLDDKDDNQPKL